MTAKRFRTEDGTLFATSSTRRFVTFGVDDFDGKAYVIKRTDSPRTATTNHRHARERFRRRIVTIDFGNGFNIPAHILFDTDRTVPR